MCGAGSVPSTWHVPRDRMGKWKEWRDHVPSVVPAECMVYLTPDCSISRWTSAIWAETEAEAVVLVSGDFVKTGGMDRANFALAEYLAARGRDLHLVAYRVDPGLLGRPGVSFHRVAKPLNAYLLAEPMLRRAGRRLAGRLSARGARVVVNGGCCDWGDINWVHYVHAAWAPRPGRGPAQAGQGGRLAPADARRRAREPAPGQGRGRQLGADPGRVDRPPRPLARPGPHGLLRRRPGSVPAGDRRRAGRGSRGVSGGPPTAPRSRSSARWATSARASTPCSRPGGGSAPTPAGTPA